MGSVFGWSAGDSSRSNFSCCFDHRYGFPSNIARVYSSLGNLRLVLPVNTSFSSSVTSFQGTLWLVRRRRCPSRACFEIASCQNDSLELACHDRVCSSSEKSYLKNEWGKNRSSIMVSILNSNFLSTSESSLYFSSNCFTIT
ncbi:hypothetical protein NC652_036162 [Populus alba x Populus x berolinensis]|nr:hypothetical protein NC652_036162 [Populus alba x Populus x berolinensis]